MGTRVATGWKVPSIPAAMFPSGAPGAAIGASGPNRWASIILLAEGLGHSDQKSRQRAVTSLKESLNAKPQNARVKQLLVGMEDPKR